MPVLNTADDLHLGTAQVDAVYLAATKVWPSSPVTTDGLRIWFDASRLSQVTGAAVDPWPNLGPGGPGLIVGSPAPKISANQLNGLKVVRFTVSEGRVRMTGTGVDIAHTLVYVARMVPGGYSKGRVVCASFPPPNFLIGWWDGNEDVAYSTTGAFFQPDTKAPATNNWRMYGSDAWEAPNYYPRLFNDGVQLSVGGVAGGAATSADSFTNTFSINGYDPANADETCDCEVAEILLYDRKLSETERLQVENYLRMKWRISLDPDTSAYLAATGLDPSHAPTLDNLVVGLKQYGLWSKMSAVYPMIGGTADLHKWNLINPVDSDAAYRLTFTGGEHTTALGYRPNPQGAVGSGGYADAHLIPLGTLAQDSTHLAYYSLADVPPISRCEMGCYNWSGPGSRFHLIARYTPSEFYYGMSEDGATNVTVPASTGLFVTTRTAPTVQTPYRNGVQLGMDTKPSIPLPPMSVWVGGINVFVDRSDLPCGFASIGSGLTAQNVADLYTVVQAFQTALGRSV